MLHRRSPMTAVHNPIMPQDQKPVKEDFGPMPAHWMVEFKNMPEWLNRCLQLSFSVLCLLSLGHANLKTVWRVCNTEDKSDWLNKKKRLLDRIENITVIAGLLLTSTSAFATTLPPLTPLFDYTTTAPYICSLASFGSVLGSLIVGSSVLFMLAKCSQEWFRDTLMGSRSSICLTLIILAYPFFSIAAAACVMLIGLEAYWSSLFRVSYFLRSFTLRCHGAAYAPILHRSPVTSRRPIPPGRRLLLRKYSFPSRHPTSTIQTMTTCEHGSFRSLRYTLFDVDR
ncbi:unnamed protein product [Somion occarium]|uniref:PGG domain-containing protein n=1 Tax=Somion occarium TaxID=3059160 RepID=A0ABP1CU33_9APHY